MGQNENKAYTLKYHRLAASEAAQLDSFWGQEVRVAIETKLFTRPELFGKPLRQSLKGCRSLRVGDYRVVFRIEGNVVRVLAIIHRSSNYRGIEARL